jgi:hypothetical protein
MKSFSETITSGKRPVIKCVGGKAHCIETHIIQREVRTEFRQQDEYGIEKDSICTSYKTFL